MKIIIVRDGKLRLFTNETEIEMGSGDATILPAKTTFCIVPTETTSLTCIFIDPEYAQDLVYWRYRRLFSNRSQAGELADRLYSDLRVTIRLGNHFDLLEPVLDRMAQLSSMNDFSSYANQIQGLWFSLAQALTVGGGAVWNTSLAVAGTHVDKNAPSPLRREVLRIEELLCAHPERNWTMGDLAREVHLSPNYLAALYTRSLGISPTKRLQQIRVDRLARLLRDTTIPVKECVRKVGWRNHAHAVRVFFATVGVTPSTYRAMSVTRSRD